MSENKNIFDILTRPPWLLYTLYLSLLILIALEPFVHKHIYFPWEKWPGFYGVLGFTVCGILVLAAAGILRPLAGRDEDYYD